MMYTLPKDVFDWEEQYTQSRISLDELIQQVFDLAYEQGRQSVLNNFTTLVDFHMNTEKKQNENA